MSRFKTKVFLTTFLFGEEVVFFNTASFIVLCTSVFSVALDITYVVIILQMQWQKYTDWSSGACFSVHNIPQTRASKCQFRDRYSHKMTRILTVCFVLLLVLKRLCHMFSFKNSQSTEITLHIIQLMFLKLHCILSLVSRTFL